MALAKKDVFPDARVSVGYGFRETLAPPINQKQPDMFTGGVIFNLPIWYGSKIRPRIREEQAKQAAATAARQSAWSQLNAMIKDRYAKLQRLAQQIRSTIRASSHRPDRGRKPLWPPIRWEPWLLFSSTRT